MKRQSAFNITIDLGNGVKITAPFKKTWSLAEWRRMHAYISTCIGNAAPREDAKRP